jgi:hypothetical protein
VNKKLARTNRLQIPECALCSLDVVPGPETPERTQRLAYLVLCSCGLPGPLQHHSPLVQYLHLFIWHGEIVGALRRLHEGALGLVPFVQVRQQLFLNGQPTGVIEARPAGPR